MTVAPDSLTVTKTGTIYVTDGAAVRPGCGKVFAISNGTVTTVVDAAHLGAPAGIALTFDESALLVSAQRNSPTGRDEVPIVSLSTHQITSATKVISQNKGSSGGLHRARGSDVYSWAGKEHSVGSAVTGIVSPGTGSSIVPGQVYLVRLR